MSRFNPQKKGGCFCRRSPKHHEDNNKGNSLINSFLEAKPSCLFRNTDIIANSVKVLWRLIILKIVLLKKLYIYISRNSHKQNCSSLLLTSPKDIITIKPARLYTGDAR